MGTKDENGHAANREETNAATPVLRIRALDPVLLSGAAVIIGFLSYLGNTSNRNQDVRKAELTAVEVRSRDYTNQQFDRISESFRDFRRADEIREAKQDDDIKTMRGIWLQMK